MKTIHTRTTHGHLFRACCSKEGSQPSSLSFGRDSKAGSEVGTLLVEKKGKFRCALVGAVL